MLNLLKKVICGKNQKSASEWYFSINKIEMERNILFHFIHHQYTSVFPYPLSLYLISFLFFSGSDIAHILGCLIVMWYFYGRSPTVTNGYHCWQVPFFKLLLSKLEPNPFISLQVTVCESNQPPNLLQTWKKMNFVCWSNTTFYVSKLYHKPRPSSINIIQTLLCRMEWFRNGLPNFVVVVRAQKPYQVQVVQMRSLHQKLSIKFMILFWMTCKWKCVR